MGELCVECHEISAAFGAIIGRHQHIAAGNRLIQFLVIGHFIGDQLGTILAQHNIACCKHAAGFFVYSDLISLKADWLVVRQS